MNMANLCKYSYKAKRRCLLVNCQLLYTITVLIRQCCEPFTIMTGILVPYCPGVIENLAFPVYGTPTQNTLAILELPSEIR